MKKRYSIFVEIMDSVDDIIAETDNEAYEIAMRIINERKYNVIDVSYIGVEDFEELEEQLTLDI